LHYINCLLLTYLQKAVVTFRQAYGYLPSSLPLGQYTDDKILISRHRTHGPLHRQKRHQFHEEEIWRTLQKMASYWAEEYTTSQLHHSSCTKVNKFLREHLILFKRIYFWQHFACLCERIFNCCNILLSRRS